MLQASHSHSVPSEPSAGPRKVYPEPSGMDGDWYCSRGSAVPSDREARHSWKSRAPSVRVSVR